MEIEIRITASDARTSANCGAEAWDVDVDVSVGSEMVSGEVTVAPDKGRSTVRRRHPCGAVGDSLDCWMSDELRAVVARVEALAGRSAARDLIHEIESAAGDVADEAIRAAD